MILNDTGETRVRGYLYLLDRSLRRFLPRDVVTDAVREVESHIRERVGQVDPVPDARAALERVLGELGPPLRVAQAYASELTVDEALTTGRFVAVARALWHFATTTTAGFFGLLGLFVGYTAGIAFLVVALMKPIFSAPCLAYLRINSPSPPLSASSAVYSRSASISISWNPAAVSLAR